MVQGRSKGGMGNEADGGGGGQDGLRNPPRVEADWSRAQGDARERVHPSFELIEDGRGNLYRVALVGSINNCGVIKPRFAVKRTELEKWEARYLPAQDFGVLILTTTEGVISQTKAKQIGVGGKLIPHGY